MRQQERLRLSQAEPEEGDGLARHLAFPGAEIAAIEGWIRQILHDGEDLARQERLLRSVPGIGPVAAAVLLGLMPELGRLSSKAAAALAGLAPCNHDSGRKRGRDALYMAAIAAARSASRFAKAARDMRARNKPFKLVMIAIARKILVTANAIIRQQAPFERAR
ncbi:transposase [Hyphomicrobiales bacterium]|nr:transposase [Hyphomicrobiales bacterium]